MNSTICCCYLIGLDWPLASSHQTLDFSFHITSSSHESQSLCRLSARSLAVSKGMKLWSTCLGKGQSVWRKRWVNCPPAAPKKREMAGDYEWLNRVWFLGAVEKRWWRKWNVVWRMKNTRKMSHCCLHLVVSLTAWLKKGKSTIIKILKT